MSYYKTPLVPDVSGSVSQHQQGATLTEAEMKRKILNGEIRREDLTIKERYRWDETLKIREQRGQNF